MTASQAK